VIFTPSDLDDISNDPSGKWISLGLELTTGDYPEEFHLKLQALGKTEKGRESNVKKKSFLLNLATGKPCGDFDRDYLNTLRRALKEVLKGSTSPKKSEKREERAALKKKPIRKKVEVL
jgi:hypothetical protein